MRLLLFTLSLSFLLLKGYGQAFKAEKIILPDTKLTNFYRVDSTVYRSDQPTAADFKALEAFGIKEVLNLRYFHDDADETAGTSLITHHIRTHAHSISGKQLLEAMRIIQNRQGPILIHCRHGSDRTGSVIALYRILFQHVAKEEAIKELKEGGFGYHSIFFNIPKTLNKIDIDRFKKELDK